MRVSVIAESDSILSSDEETNGAQPGRELDGEAFVERMRAAEERAARLEQENADLSRRLEEQATRFQLEIGELRQRLGENVAPPVESRLGSVAAEALRTRSNDRREVAEIKREDASKRNVRSAKQEFDPQEAASGASTASAIPVETGETSGWRDEREAREDVVMRLVCHAKKDRRARLRRKIKEHALLMAVVLLALGVAGLFGWLAWTRAQVNPHLNSPTETRY